MAGEDALHALGVVAVVGVALGAGPEADGAVVGGGEEVLAGGGELDVHDGGDVVFVDVEGAGHLAHVEDFGGVLDGVLRREVGWGRYRRCCDLRWLLRS